MSGATLQTSETTPPKAGRARHQITRSITEFSPSMKLRQHRQLDHQHKHRPHHSHHHGRPSRHRRRHLHEDGATQSAGGLLQQTRKSLDLSPPGFAEHGVSPSTSRRPSVGDEDMAAMLSTRVPGVLRGNIQDEVRNEGEKSAIRLKALKKTLLDLHDFSNSTTRQLDETYYSVLEKTSMLQSTITAMKELATMSHAAKATFEKESVDMVQDVQGQLTALGHFDAQEKRIVGLQNRIQEGRSKIQALSGRVDVVHQRVENWERADADWQEKTRKRLKSVWIALSFILGLVAVLFVFARFAPPMYELKTLDAPNSTSSFSLLRRSRKDSGSSQLASSKQGDHDPNLHLWRSRGADEEEDPLHFLDEL